MLETDEGLRTQEQEVRVQERRGGRGVSRRRGRLPKDGRKIGRETGEKAVGVQMGSLAISPPLGEM